MRKNKTLEQLSALKFEQLSNVNLGMLNGGEAKSLTFIQGENTYVTVNTDIIGHEDNGGTGTIIIDCGR